MEHVELWPQLNIGDTIIAVESADGNVNTFQGVVTDINHGDITLNNQFSFSWTADDDQYILRLANAPHYNGRHRK